jgi:GNAT superfamily N-acetyltransferase
MNIPPWHEEPISKKHDRGAFDCGEELLNDFLRKYALKNHEAGGAKTLLAINDADGKTILGFYSLGSTAVEYARPPGIVKRGLGRYEVPGFRLVRLAVARTFQGKGLGGQLLMAAGRRCAQVAQEVGGVVLVIDAKNENIAKWYATYGAISLDDAPLTIMLPLATIQAALDTAENEGAE